MSNLHNLPHLEILPVEKLILHEYHDQQRTPPIIQSIEEDGLLRNPPVVVPLADGTGRYMVLDGANRATALRDMGVPHTIVQTVQGTDPGLELTSWNHVVWGVAPDTLKDWLRSVPGLNLLPSSEENLYRSLLDIHSLAMLHLADGLIYTVHTQEIELVNRVRVLNALVDSYAKNTSMDRTTNYTIEPLQSMYADLSGLVLLPPFRIEDVLYLASQGHLMPTGSTRFTISGRALRINFPLEILKDGQSLEQKSAWLQEWLQDNLSRKRLRYYAEPVFMFDE
ncbi:ParB N-terminal domain-containing protein [Chloroflexota bacterium]